MSAEKRIYLSEISYLVDTDSALDLVQDVLAHAARGETATLDSLLDRNPNKLPTVESINPARWFKRLTEPLINLFLDSIAGADIDVDVDRPDTGLGVGVLVRSLRGNQMQEAELVVQYPGKIAGLRLIQPYKGERFWDEQ